MGIASAAVNGHLITRNVNGVTGQLTNARHLSHERPSGHDLTDRPCSLSTGVRAQEPLVLEVTNGANL